MEKAFSFEEDRSPFKRQDLRKVASEKPYVSKELSQLDSDDSESGNSKENSKPIPLQYAMKVLGKSSDTATLSVSLGRDSYLLNKTSEEVTRYARIVKRKLGSNTFSFDSDLIRNDLLSKLQINYMRPLSSGAFGTVYAARDVNGSRYAVKVMKSLYNVKAYAENVFKRRFLREVCFLRKLTSHSNIVNYYDSALLLGSRVGVIKMELLNGSLGDFCKKNPVPIVVLTDVVQQIGSALLFMHERLFVHHDIKLENIGVCLQQVAKDEHPLVNGTFKLIDFGLASCYSAERMFESHFPGGTPLYMPIEKHFIQKPFNPFLSDAYSLGMCLLFASVGERKSFKIIDKYESKMRHKKSLESTLPDESFMLDMRSIGGFILKKYSKNLNVGKFDKEFANDFHSLIISLLDDEEKSDNRPARIGIAEAMDRCDQMIRLATLRQQSKSIVDKEEFDNEQQNRSM